MYTCSLETCQSFWSQLTFIFVCRFNMLIILIIIYYVIFPSILLSSHLSFYLTWYHSTSLSILPPFFLSFYSYLSILLSIYANLNLSFFSISFVSFFYRFSSIYLSFYLSFHLSISPIGIIISIKKISLDQAYVAGEVLISCLDFLFKYLSICQKISLSHNLFI